MASGQTLAFFTPRQDEPPASNPATFVVRNGRLLLAFDQTTQEIAVFSGGMPRHYAGGGITAYLTWLAVPTSGSVGWDVTFERTSDGSLDTDSDGFATAQTVTASAVPGTSGVEKTTTVAITAGAAGTDSVIAGDHFRLRVRRDVANDDAAGDAQLVLVELKET